MSLCLWLCSLKAHDVRYGDHQKESLEGRHHVSYESDWTPPAESRAGRIWTEGTCIWFYGTRNRQTLLHLVIVVQEK